MQRTKLLALLACGLILASLTPMTRGTAIWDTIVPVDGGVWYQASFYENPIPGLQANGTLAGTPGALDPPQVTSFGRKLLMKDVSKRTEQAFSET
ncbi:g5914 [Coccomyxa elongata]